MKVKARRLGTGRRIGSLCLTAVMAVSLAAGNIIALAQHSGKNAVADNKYDSVSFENMNGKMDLTSFALQNLNKNVEKSTDKNQNAATAGVNTVIVTLENESIIDKLPQGQSVSEYLNTYSGENTLTAIEKTQNNFLTRLKNLGVDYTLKRSYATVTNAVAIKVHTKHLSAIKSMDGVSSAVVSQNYNFPEAVTSDSIANVYNTGIYNSSSYVENGLDGRGMTVAVLDTGIDYTHEAFRAEIMDDVSESEYGMTKSYLSGNNADGVNITEALAAVKSSALKGANITAEDLYVSAKIPFAYDYADSDADVYPSYSQHGTHVAGIVGGQADKYTDKDGNIATDENGEIISFQGVAPKAQLVICKVFTDDFDSKDLGGATSDSIIAALNDCVTLGVDVVNMSLGTVAGFSSKELGGDDEGIALSKIYNKMKSKGISVICAASNEYSSGFGSAFGTNKASNPDSGTVGSPSTFAGSMSVASINGQLSDYLLANGSDRIFFNNSSGADGKRYDFVEQILGKTGGKTATYKYVTVSGTGEVANYSRRIQQELADKTYNGKPVDGTIALIKRGGPTFQTKVYNAMTFGADAVIIYNNVSGTVSMSLGDIDDPVPAIAVNMDAGTLLTEDAATGKGRSTGIIEINDSYLAGPFMNDYSSWGSTPDLRLKPEVTAHGGEITSAVAGGYSEMSGTSMASPNLAGFVALLRSHIKTNADKYGVKTDGKIDNVKLTRVINQIMMSTAETVYDQEGLPYSPRKQGAGLATLDNVMNSNAYLYTIEGKDNGGEDNRPKIELGEDEKKQGNYTLKFYVANFGNTDLKFKAETIFMTETLAANGLSVAEKAYLLNDNPAEWYVNGKKITSGAEFTVAANAGQVPVEVRLSLSAKEKSYIDTSFENGMFVEGFLKLVSQTENQCSLTLPFMGFYGDWESAPMLDYDCYEISEFEQDTSYTDETRPNASVWATQAYATYYNEQYFVPMGGYSYVQDEAADKIYVDPEHAAVSCFNDYYGEDNNSNYLTTTGIRALYAGLLRNAELVTYSLYDEYTGEQIAVPNSNIYRVGKAYANGGSSSPAFVKMDLNPLDLGLKANGKYRLEFHFYQYAEDADDPEKQNDGNTFTMSFYVDYEAPVLVDTRIRYYDYKDGNKDKQRIYLDLDVFDNNYAQSVILCYSEREYNEEDEVDTNLLKMVTRYVTPVYNAVKNGTTTVTIEITDIYEKFGGKLYVQLDDYALNHSMYKLNFNNSSDYSLPETFDIVGDKEITIDVNEVRKIELSYEGEASPSAFTWECRRGMGNIKVKNGEIFGVKPGTSYVTVTGRGVSREIIVHVVDSNRELSVPNLSFGVIETSDGSLKKAQGIVKVNAGQKINLEVVSEAWYYPVSSLKLRWSSSKEDIAKVDENGVVITQEKKGDSIITAIAVDSNGKELARTQVTLSVQEPFTVNNYVLTDYNGLGGENGVLKIPDDQNIMNIGEDAFKDNNNIRVIIIPRTVTQINESAFENCKALEEVYFISQEKLPVADADLSVIRRYAFRGCNKLKKVDLSNCKTITLDRDVFRNCTALEQVVEMQKIGTMNDRAFEGCTSLKEVNLGAISGTTITGLHICGSAVFKGCTSLEKVVLDKFTAVGDEMFRGCSKLTTVEGLSSVAQIGDRAFEGTPYQANMSDGVYSGNTLLLAPKNATGFTLKSGTTEIAPYAFAGCTVDTVNLSGVLKIGEGAFAYSTLSSVTLPNLNIIHANAFRGTKITTITIPASVETIGEGAFAGCGNLETVVFASGGKLSKIGSSVFSGTKLTSVSLPETVVEIGDTLFANCQSLSEVNIPAVKSLGAYTFLNCPNLTTATFGDKAETTGDYTFAAGKFIVNGNTVTYNSSLSSVTLGSGINKIGAGVFANCDKLTSVNLGNVTEVGDGAFEGCVNLQTVTGLNKVKVIGSAAFAYCTSLPDALDLTAAEQIGSNAFYNVGNSSVNFPNVKEIGAYAFFGSNLGSLTVPASVTKIGDGAFAGSLKLNTVAVANGNTKFFVEENVLYRYITKTTYELCIYPSNRTASADNGYLNYKVKDGTVSVQGGSFSDLKAGTLQKVFLPYSVKVIGAFAFYNSGITEYTFESINAPVLFVEDINHRYKQYGYNTLFYTNFGEEVVNYITLNMFGVYDGTSSTLIINCPTNGIGYDNLIFQKYFGAKTLLGELIDDNTRLVKNLIEGFESPEDISGWNTSTAEYEDVLLFSEQVKEAHRLLNDIISKTQLDFLGSENIEKLYSVEAALKPVKQLFGIQVTAVSLSVDPECSYKSEYKVGDKFNMKGLRIIVTYDDYSTELADMSKISLVSGYDGKLDELKRYVRVQGYGLTLDIAINVTEGGPSEFKAVYVWAPIVGVLGAAAIAVGCVFLIKKLKKDKQAVKDGAVNESAAADTVTETSEADKALTEVLTPEAAAEAVQKAEPVTEDVKTAESEAENKQNSDKTENTAESGAKSSDKTEKSAKSDSVKSGSSTAKRKTSVAKSNGNTSQKSGKPKQSTGKSEKKD